MNRDFEDLGGRDPHDIVGVAPGADRAEITRRFRQRLRRTHPDAGGNHRDQVMLNLARDILLDPVRLREYQQKIRRPAPEQKVRKPAPQARRPAARRPPASEPTDDPFRWESGVGPTPRPHRPPPRRPYVQADHVEPTVYDIFDPPRPAYHPPPPRPVPRPRRNVLATVSLAVSLCVPLAGIVLGVVALYQIRRRQERGRGVAWLGIAVSVVTTLAPWLANLA